MKPEFSRPIRIDTLGPAPRSIAIEAEAEEREALARRFGLLSIAALSAQASVSRAGEAVVASGRLEAAVTQACVATGEPVEARIAEDFRIEFRPHPETGPEEEIELGEDELDVVFYDSAAVDLGEAVAESLSLALDPYPRSPASEAALKEAGVKSEEEARAESSPFAALAGLKDKLK
ncbi:MAG: YceD family protein [Allosphingosinicella sp.]